MKSEHFSRVANLFHGKIAPEPGVLAGYAALIDVFELKVPYPDRLVIISERHRRYETDQWLVLTPRHQPKPNLSSHLIFALRYEGIDLRILKKLFEIIPEKEIREMIEKEPSGIYIRKIWFLYEWLLNVELNLKLPQNYSRLGYIDLVDEKLQYAAKGVQSKRHRVFNNLPGVKEFCPMVRKTAVIEEHLKLNLSSTIKTIVGKIHPDVMARTAAFLLLKDSKASYAIEGEDPPLTRAHRWGYAIGQAGEKKLSEEELLRLQQIVIDKPRFTKLGFREQEGFIGEHDRRYGTPIPDHISARYKDLTSLIKGLIETDRKLEDDESIDAVLVSAIIAFGFVFIHPFVDGNGRIHRFLIHHVLARKNYVPRGLIFPVSGIILEKLDEYRTVLESYSRPLLDFIEWKPTKDNNVEVLNETIDFYRYFDATKQVEFLYKCVRETIEHTIPAEITYLEKHDRMKRYLDDLYDMPDKTVALAVRFLEQGSGKFSKRALANEFKELTAEEAEAIEKKYQEIFRDK